MKTTNQTEKTDWIAPVYPLGTRVTCSINGNANELVHPGRIVRQCGGGICSIAVDVCDNYSQFYSKNCKTSFHADDPRIKKFSPEYWSEENCIYRLADIEEKSMTLLGRIAELERILAVTSAASPLSAKRGPGRPRKEAATETRLPEPELV